MKVTLLESQYDLILEFQKRAYSFDWDDNILMMPTTIKLERKVGGGWVPIEVSTEEFREVRGKIGDDLRFLNDDPKDAFKDFRDFQAFIDDTKIAIRRKKFGPSFKKFKEALMYGNDFSIITARGNPPQAIKEGVKVLIDMTFSPEEKSFMEENLRGTTIDQYLNLQDYHPVSSDEFMERFGISGSATSPEKAKTMALKNFVERVVKESKKIVEDDEVTGLSVGFSDDDLGNVKVAEKFIEEELKKLYPNVRFLVYDTSDPKNVNKKRIIVTI
jgi:hypothetical protein